MNEKNLARVTVVLSRRTAEQLRYLSRRMGVSASALVRESISEPIDQLASCMADVPTAPTAADAEAFGQRMLQFVDAEVADLRAEVNKGAHREE